MHGPSGISERGWDNPFTIHQSRLVRSSRGANEAREIRLCNAFGLTFSNAVTHIYFDEKIFEMMTCPGLIERDENKQ